MNKRTEDFLDAHGPKIGAALMALSSVFMVGLMAFLFTLAAPRWIEIQEQLTSALAHIEEKR